MNYQMVVLACYRAMANAPMRTDMATVEIMLMLMLLAAPVLGVMPVVLP
jgi:hypothetical protein